MHGSATTKSPPPPPLAARGNMLSAYSKHSQFVAMVLMTVGRASTCSWLRRAVDGLLQFEAMLQAGATLAILSPITNMNNISNG